METKPNSKRYKRIGIGLTVVWFIFVISYLALDGGNPFCLKPNEFGDFFAGAFGPIAILWIILGFWQQGDELRNSVDALEHQSKELAESVEQQKALVEVSRQQVLAETTARQETIEREHRVARAGLTHALSEIHEYAEDCLKLLCSRYKAAVQAGNTISLTGPWELKKYPYASFRSVADCLLGASTELADQLADFHAFGQIQKSRLKSQIDRFIEKPSNGATEALGSYQLHSVIVDALELMAWADRFYEYGRRKLDTAEPIASKAWAKDRFSFLNLYTDDKLMHYIDSNWHPYNQDAPSLQTPA